MDSPYWTVDDAIIFKPEFDSSLDDYTSIISNYRILIFSNYSDPHQALKNNNIYDDEEDMCVGSSFNQPLIKFFDNKNFYEAPENNHDYFLGRPLINSLHKLTNLRELTFSNYFNYPLVDSLDKLVNLQKLTFGNYFNCQLSNSLDKLVNLQKLTFGNDFNQSLTDCLDKLPNLTHIGLGYNFNQRDDLPFNIKSISLNCNNKYYVDYLPTSIEEINFGYRFNLELNNLPSSIKKISFSKNSKYNKELNCLPNSLKILELPTDYKHEIKFNKI